MVIDFARFLALQDDIQPPEFVIAGDICALGRATECQLVIPRKIVSRLHAKIERDGPRYVLRDAGSANGTFVNSQRIYQPHVLKNRDLIGLGASTPLLRFLDPDPTFESEELLTYDPQTLRFYVGKQPLILTPSQFRLLLHLYQNAGSICTRESCMEAVWGAEYDRDLNSQVLDGVISELRRKLREIDGTADCIVTRRGLGYELVF